MNRCEYAPVYKVTRKKFENKDIGAPHTGYGISCKRKDIFTGKLITRRIDDISIDPGIVRDMTDLFNKCCLSPDCFRLAVLSLIS